MDEKDTTVAEALAALHKSAEYSTNTVKALVAVIVEMQERMKAIEEANKMRLM